MSSLQKALEGQRRQQVRTPASVCAYAPASVCASALVPALMSVKRILAFQSSCHGGERPVQVAGLSD